ncbi:MAG: carbohydrate kinase [Oscillospiraceae bacterium]|nr:carbohydrate kinase [Oscillospiraceae bacterium]
MFTVTALGELLIDFTEKGYSENGQRLFEQNPGGAPANVLVALQRLGARTAFLGKVGTDMHGSYLRETLQHEGVNIEGLIADDHFFTTLAFVALNSAGERHFSFARKPGADTQLRPDELRKDIIQNSRIFHTGSLSLTGEPVRSATLEALKTAQKAGCVLSYDPNYRAPLWDSREEAARQMRRVLPYMDLVKISDEETELLTGCARPEDAAAKLVEYAKAAVVTLGGKGAYVCTKEGGTIVPTFAGKVVDTTGAGDSFWGGFLFAFLQSGIAVENITLEQAKSFARFGNAAATLCVGKRGGIPAMPTLSETEALLKTAATE